MKKIIIFISFILFTLNSWSQIVCSDETRNSTLSFLDLKNNLWDFSQISFYHPKYLASYLTCSKFIESISENYKGRSAQIHLQPLYPVDAFNLRVKFESPLNQEILEKCSNTNGCKVAFFQNIFNPIYAFKSFRKKDVYENMPYCHHKSELIGSPFTARANARIDFSLANDSLGELDIWRLPQDSIFNKMMAYLEKNKPEFSIISTMIPSLSILQKLDQWLVANPKSHIYVLFAFNLASLQDNFPTQFNFNSGRLHVLPVFQTHLNPESYHIKGGLFISENKSEVLLHSVNLRRFREEKVADIAFVSANKDLVDSYGAILSSVLKFQCDNKRWLNCSQELRYFENDKRRLKINTFVEVTCQKYYSDLANKLSQFKMPAVPVIQTGSNSLLKQLVALVASAKKEIIISSHVYGYSLFDHALKEAHERGVKIKMLIGSNIKKKELRKYLIEKYDAKIINDEIEYTSHAKFMIVDGAHVVWGSGNLTKTSLNNPMDLFLITKDPFLKKELLDYFQTYFKK